MPPCRATGDECSSRRAEDGSREEDEGCSEQHDRCNLEAMPDWGPQFMLHVRGPSVACEVAERTMDRPSVRQAARRASEVTGESGRRGSAIVQVGAGATGRKRRAASDDAAARFDDRPIDSRDALGSFALMRGFI